MNDVREEILSRLDYVLKRYAVRTAPGALIMMLTTDKENGWSGWSEASEEQQTELTGWVAKNVTVDDATCLLIDLATRGLEYIDFDPDLYNLSGEG
ncbi:MAG: hypothetical protein NTX28_06350 [Novosphingobium sp.]|nr:hypothetical protein [Novosphingobium sp.]